MSLVDRGQSMFWKDRTDMEVWLHQHGVKHVEQIERVTFRPWRLYAIAMYPWSEDYGRLCVNVPLAREEVIRLDSSPGDEEWRLSLKVPCLFCGAHENDWCFSKGGKPRDRELGPHERRLFTAGLRGEVLDAEDSWTELAATD